MRSATSLTGKRIISVDNGTNLGTVKDVYFDTDVNSVIGLFLGNQGLWTRKANLIPRSAVTLFGKDAILVSQSDVVTDNTQTDSEWIRRDRLPGRLITSAGGTKVATISDTLIDGEGAVKGFMLAMIFVDSPATAGRFISRDVVLDVGSATSPMKIDLAKAEEQHSSSEE
ncbi:MAG: PRC-barrel domain-containing protein [Ardenticatenaceae bacterium]